MPVLGEDLAGVRGDGARGEEAARWVWVLLRVSLLLPAAEGRPVLRLTAPSMMPSRPRPQPLAPGTAKVSSTWVAPSMLRRLASPSSSFGVPSAPLKRSTVNSGESALCGRSTIGLDLVPM
ncbi:hypothetical protein SF12_06005 [Streptomyces sp. MBRL 601]|nr:hypothetical protein SF12_06005 [Streptomyces sp. MBRL 601]